MSTTIEEARSAADRQAAVAVMHAVYIGEGYTSAERGQQVMRPETLVQGGTLLVAKDEAGTVLGATLFLHAGSPLQQLAGMEEREFRLLAVSTAVRGRGVGEALVQACIDRAREAGARTLVLWTQPRMQAAQRLYDRLGFVRAPERDVPDPRGFDRLVYVRMCAPH